MKNIYPENYVIIIIDLKMKNFDALDGSIHYPAPKNIVCKIVCKAFDLLCLCEITELSWI